MTRVVFETATIADAAKKAERVAPSKAGSAFDKAAGTVIEINPGSVAPVIVRATNLDIFSMEWLTVVEAEGNPVTWRLPSKLLASVLGGLPIGTGKTVSMEAINNPNGFQQLMIKQGKTTAKFNLMSTDYYPDWSAFDPALVQSVSGFGGRLAQVEWACAKSDPPLSGIHFNGSIAVATDRYRVASTPMSIPHLSEPVTIPSGVLSQVLSQTGEVKIGIHGGQLLIMPDEYRQLRAIVYDQDYIKFERVMNRDFPNIIKIKKAAVLEMMVRAAGFAGADRAPVLKLYIGKGEFAVMMSNEEIGLLGDVIELDGQCDHKRLEVYFTPQNIMDPLTACPNEEVELHYDCTSRTKPMYLDGGSGFEAWIIPRRNLTDDGPSS